MWLFKKKTETKQNLINNNVEKDKAANCAIDYLKKYNIINNLEGITCEFGYIYYFPNHGYECLFKIIKENKIYYFAIQGDNITMLDLNEEIYQFHVETFLDANK